VTSNIGGMAELVRDGVDGLHFEAGSVSDLAAKLSRFTREAGLVSGLSQFRELKTLDEDARATEVRYRALASIVPDHS